VQGLTGCANTCIGSSHDGIRGVSGGEKRRTSVGVELITSPTCLFLDEPTSGLDSEIAVTIMRTLKGIAEKGRTVVLTIHQPNSDITELFDNFILMAKGNVVYGGSFRVFRVFCGP
jgi:ABC-type multidrug transport system ATPase subunit